MKKLVYAGIVAAVGLSVSSSMALIAGSKHDLSNTANKIRAANPADVNNEICVFCHTPHGSNQSFVGAPLWNKAIDTTVTYQVYGGGQTTGGTTVGQPGDVSRACLSCHDGVNAINSIINLPGSGGWNSAGNLIAFTVDNGTTTIPAGTAATMPSGITQIGTDLRNDHPVGVLYRGDEASPPASLVPTTTALPSGFVIAGDKDGNPGPTVGDLLRAGKIECVSCHDPHLGENPTFLRLANTGSQLCLTCHAK
ncbi:MAG TPA: cytochrome C [Persephonella sp.]|uniref:Cytochrome c family protein n=1 Tax=Persephonella marina (strain DSM 14350 / EX-H1) TaxID=123214 RepID=C0QRC7_PERMH|nr:MULTISPECIES: cytochrome c3 family protein [Persephonella]ACO03597.1 cytochrome c family protein [Persephonella marina EX-H1]HCB68970.1 cytochrome C [Persephonella sp.]